MTNNKGGRPRAKPGELRKGRGISLTDSEFEALQEMASSAGHANVSAYIRSLIQGHLAQSDAEPMSAPGSGALDGDPLDTSASDFVEQMIANAIDAQSKRDEPAGGRRRVLALSDEDLLQMVIDELRDKLGPPLEIQKINASFADYGTYTLASYVIRHLAALKAAQLNERKEFARLAVELFQLRSEVNDLRALKKSRDD